MASFSSLSRGIGCNRKFLLSKHFRRYAPKSEALAFGSCYHDSIEHGIEHALGMLDEAGIATEKNKKLLLEMSLRIERLMIEKGITLEENEVEFVMDIEGCTEQFKGYIDGIGTYNGKTWLLEFKTAANIDASFVSIDGQITSYLYACRELGIAEPEGVLYIINRKRLEKEPKVNKDGSLSVAKGQGCTFDAYENLAIEIYGEDIPDKILSYMDWLYENQSPNIVCIPVKRTDKDLDNFGKLMVEMIKKEEEMNNRYAGKGITQSLKEAHCMPSSYGCRMCEYSKACIELFNNENYSDEDLNEDFFIETLESE